MAEAQNLRPRIQWCSAGTQQATILGLRSGALSIFGDHEHVLHFNADGALRRAYREGQLIKAEDGRLVALTRERTATEVALVRQLWTDEQQAAWLTQMSNRIDQLCDELKRGAGVVQRKLPDDADTTTFITVLESIARPMQIARRPGLNQT